jgi:transposase-like protein
VRRIEVITGAERRRKWSADEKAEIVAESLPGVLSSRRWRAVTASVRSSCSAGVRGCALP